MGTKAYEGMSHGAEAYCDEGGIHIFHFGDDGAIDWGETHSPERDGGEYASYAAQDFAALVAQCMDPVREGWPCIGYESVDQVRDEYEEFFSGGRPDAASWYYDGYAASYLLREDPGEYSDCYARDFAREFLGNDDGEA
jgi:hypothetical protein